MTGSGRSLDPAVVQARYKTTAGAFEDTHLDRVRVQDLIESRPVREFRSWQGRRHYSGWWWSATTGTHLAYESLLERSCLLLLDANPRVHRIACQPVNLTRIVNRKPRQRIPDIIVENDDGAVSVIDVKPTERLEDPEVGRSLAWTASVCRARGWGYTVWTGPPSRTVFLNVQYLSGYRRPAVIDREAVDAVRAHASTGHTFYGLEAEVSRAERWHRLIIRPAILHLLWTGWLTADLHLPLSAGTRLEIAG